MVRTQRATAVGGAILAAALYATSFPVSKILLKRIPATMLAALLYLGAGLGMSLVGLVRRKAAKGRTEARLTRRELPYTIGMVALDIAAPILLMLGLARTTAANASLLNNFEIVATALIALLFFKEAISRRLWFAIGLITLSSMILSVEGAGSFSFSVGSLFVLLACTCWGLENNCTRVLSTKDPLQIVVVKGFGSGLGSLGIALALHETVGGSTGYMLAALLTGFVAYGLSIFFYVSAQRELGAATTSAYYAVAPFIGVALSFLVFREQPTIFFIIALLIMAAGVSIASTDRRQAR